MKTKIEIEVDIQGFVTDGFPDQPRGDGTFDKGEGPDVEDFVVLLRYGIVDLDVTEYLPEDTIEALKDEYIEANV